MVLTGHWNPIYGKALLRWALEAVTFKVVCVLGLVIPLEASDYNEHQLLGFPKEPWVAYQCEQIFPRSHWWALSFTMPNEMLAPADTQKVCLNEQMNEERFL